MLISSRRRSATFTDSQAKSYRRGSSSANPGRRWRDLGRPPKPAKLVRNTRRHARQPGTRCRGWGRLAQHASCLGWVRAPDRGLGGRLLDRNRVAVRGRGWQPAYRKMSATRRLPRHRLPLLTFRLCRFLLTEWKQSPSLHWSCRWTVS